MIVHYHLYAAKFWNGLAKIFRLLADTAHAWTGRHTDYHLDAAEQEIERLKLL